MTDSLNLAEKSELARVDLSRSPSSVRFSVHDIDQMYEASYLRIFVAWEDFLDRAFVYYLCGRPNNIGVEPLVAGQVYSRTIADAESRIYNNQPFSLWHNPHKTIVRARRFFDSGLIESVVSSDLANLEHYASVRHRIAHGHNDSKAKFDTATMSLAAIRFRGGRPGRFLRSTVHSSNPPVRWIEKIGGDFVSIASQIIP